MNNLVSLVLEVYGVDPFYSPKKFIKEHNISSKQFEEAITLITLLMPDQVFTMPSGQYWRSIQSVRSELTFNSAVKEQPVYPSRLGLYPGITCQFACNFCGRREGTEFNSKLAKDSVDMFNTILLDHVQVPNHQKNIRLSGGLEPTTNKYISDIILNIKRLGLQAEMYTNGYNFTNNWLDLHLGINLLDKIRFSIYGYDADSYKQTTEHARGHTVLDKVENFLNRSSMPVGLNFVVLQGQLDKFSKFIDWVEKVNSRTRGISWISIREDSSQNRWYLSKEERQQAKLLLDRLSKVCNNIDYGYTLWPLLQNQNIGGIKHATADQLLMYGISQITAVVDVKGDVYSYHDVFPNRAGQDKHIIGNVKDKKLIDVINDKFKQSAVSYTSDDLKFLDTSDHMITMLIRQQQELKNLGINKWLV